LFNDLNFFNRPAALTTGRLRLYLPMKAKQKPKIGRIKQIATLLCVLPNIVMSQKETIVFHNCENFFYPYKDTTSQDDDYTATGRKHWTKSRFEKKRDMLAKTYIAIGNGDFPALIGLCEIEGKEVLDELCFNSPLAKANYNYIHYDSKDIRGIDVALLYDKDKFTPDYSQQITPPIKDEDEPTRDVLYVKGRLNKNFQLHIFVIHAPSRREHNIKRQLRESIFSLVKQKIDSLCSQGENNFLIMGDMNDNPWDESIINGFGTAEGGKNKPFLTNLMQNNQNKTGSYYYEGRLLSFDQFIVSQNIRQKLIYTNPDDTTHIFNPPFLVSKDRRIKLPIPYSTYRHSKYIGGVSDHFPVYLNINI
jgi:hypothetical protein